MILRNNDIYQKVSDKHNLDIKFVESVGEIVFSDLIEKLNSPTEISYELPKVGAWNIRQKNFKKTYRKTPDEFKKQWEPLLDKLEKFKEAKAKKREERRRDVTK